MGSLILVVGPLSSLALLMPACTRFRTGVRTVPVDPGGPRRSACSGERTDTTCQSVGQVLGLRGRRHRSRVAVLREGKVRSRYK